MKNAVLKKNHENGQDLTKALRKLIEKNHLNMCLECGKCSAVCPMVAFYGGEFVYQRSSRAISEKLCFDATGIYDEAIWYCLACQECTFFCPSGVDFQTFMMDLRKLLISKGHREFAHFCSECGGYMMPKQQVNTLQKSLNGKGDLLFECPTCKRNRQAEAMRRFYPYGSRNVKSREEVALPDL